MFESGLTRGATLFVFALALSSCSGGGADATPRVPLPGDKTVPQVHLLRSKNSFANAVEFPPLAAALSEGLSAHAEDFIFESKEQAVELAKQLSGRSQDVLILVGEDACAAWLAAKSAEVSKRPILALCEHGPARATLLSVDRAPLKSLSLQVCKELGKGCDPEVVLKVAVKWFELIRFALQQARDSRGLGDRFVIDAGSGYLSVSPSDSLRGEQLDRAKSLVVGFQLQALSKGKVGR